jgi:3',5'-cyclic AMP phosphodiesterase CpdA
MVRFVHYSDVHISQRGLRWRTRDLLSKKAFGWVNVNLLGRGYRFRHARQIAEAMVQEIATSTVDAALFSGDATKLAFESEFKLAAEVLRADDATMPPLVAVPGNHDYYTKRDVRRGLFEKYFGSCLSGLRIDDHCYPYARKFGHVWIIALNSSNPTRLNTTARGKVGYEQLQRLKQLCAQLDPGPRVILTHYPLLAHDRSVVSAQRRLSDFRNAMKAAQDCQISLWIHGHQHKPYILTPGEDLPFTTICVGSATQTRRWSHNLYEIIDSRLSLTRRSWNPLLACFETSLTAEFDLTVPVSVQSVV